MSVCHLELKDVNWRPEQPVLTSVSCQFERQAINGIVGANGAGKSSLLKIAQGVIQPDSGTVRVNEQPIHQFDRVTLARQIAVVPQSTSILFDLSVFDIVRMALIPKKGLFEFDNSTDRELIDACLEQTGSLAFKHRNYNSLSGGEQQRVLLARALVQETEIILLDEPTSHLDVYYQHQILGLLKHLNKTVIMSIHDLNLAAQYCDQIWVLKSGRVLGGGVPNVILNQEVLQLAFDLPCAVSVDPKTNIPTICFHPVTLSV